MEILNISPTCGPRQISSPTCKCLPSHLLWQNVNISGMYVIFVFTEEASPQWKDQGTRLFIESKCFSDSLIRMYTRYKAYHRRHLCSVTHSGATKKPRTVKLLLSLLERWHFYGNVCMNLYVFINSRFATHSHSIHINTLTWKGMDV